MSDELKTHNFVTRDEFMQWVDKFTDRMDEKFDRLDSRFDELGTTLSKAIGRIGVTEASKGTIPLGVIAVIVGTILSLGSVVGALTIVPLAVAQDRHASLEGHPQTMMKLATEGERLDRAFGDIKKNSSGLHELDTASQREMRLLDSEMKAEFSSQIASIESRLGTAEKWTVGHDQQVAPLNASQWAEIRNNTKEIERLRNKYLKGKEPE